MISQLGLPLTAPNGRHTLEGMDRMELFWEAEKTLIMHKLSKEYFGFRAFWFQFLPLLLITSFTTIIGFLTTGMAVSSGSVDGTEAVSSSNLKGLSDQVFNKTRQWLSLSVGILGALSTFLTSMSRYTNYQSKRDMHEMAEEGLKGVIHSISFEDHNHSGEEASRAREHLDKQKAIFVSIETACTAEIPPKIQQAFVDLDSTMKAKPFDFRVSHYKRFYNMLWKAFTKRSFCCFMTMPHYIPEINVPTGHVGMLIEEEYIKYKQEEKDRVALAFSSMGHPTPPKGPAVAYYPNQSWNSCDSPPLGEVASSVDTTPAGSNYSVSNDINGKRATEKMKDEVVVEDLAAVTAAKEVWQKSLPDEKELDDSIEPHD